MKKNAVILILIVLIIALGGYYYMQDRAAAPEQVQVQEETAARTFSWRFTTTESEDGLPPRTTVALITGGDVYNLGGFAGSCAEIAAENLLENEVAGVLCWWAGGGDELGIFLENGRYVIKHGVQEEPTAESEGFRGEFEEVAVIE